MSNQPYIGLRPFERNETDIFFGREKHSDELINRLGSNHLLAVIGTSGCGKSSLVKTGLIAGLEAGYLAQVGTHWQIVEMRPGQQPFKVLAEKLLTELHPILSADYTAESLEQVLRQGSLSLHELLAKHPLPDNAQLLIVCDQFEEIFRYFQQGEAAEAKNFVSLFLASSKPYPLSSTHISHSIYVVATMRSDFLGDCAQFAGLAEAINQGLYLTPRLDVEQLRAAIEEPAFGFGGEVEPALVTKLLEDAENNQDQLPLLQHALMIMWWLAAKAGTKQLTLSLFNAEIGGLEQALSKRLDNIFAELSPAQQRIAEIMFRNLTERADVQRDMRRPIQLAELVELTSATFAEVVTVIDEFRQAGRCFLMPPINVKLNNDSVIDISHESLIRQWQTLQKWAVDEAENAKTYQRLEDRAVEWKKGKANLLQSPELDVFLQWYQDKNTNKLWAKRYGNEFELGVDFLEKSKINQQLTIEEIKKKEQQLQQTLNVFIELAPNIITEDNKQQIENAFHQLIKINPNNVTALLYFGHILLDQKRYKEAIEKCQKAIKINHNYEHAWNCLGLIFYQQKQYEKAIESCKKAIEINSEYEFFWHNLGVILLKQNKYNEATECFKKAININYNYAESWNCLGFILNNQKQYEEASKSYKKSININSKKTEVWAELGNTLLHQEQYLEAIKSYRKSLSIDSNYLSAWNGLGLVSFHQKKYSKAAEIFSQALIKFPDDIGVLSNDLELALVQNDSVRFQQRSKILLQKIKPQYQQYVIVPFLRFLSNPQQGHKSIIKAIEKLDKNIEITWGFSTLSPAIERQDEKIQKIAYLFIDYFEKRIDLKTLKTKLAELEKTK